MNKKLEEEVIKVAKLFLKSSFMGEILKALIAIDIIIIVFYGLKLFGINSSFVPILIITTITLSVIYMWMLNSRANMEKNSKGKQMFFMVIFTILNSLILYLSVDNYLFIIVFLSFVIGLGKIGAYMEYERTYLERLFMKLREEIEEGGK